MERRQDEAIDYLGETKQEIRKDIDAHGMLKEFDRIFFGPTSKYQLNVDDRKKLKPSQYEMDRDVPRSTYVDNWMSLSIQHGEKMIVQLGKAEQHAQLSQFAIQYYKANIKCLHFLVQAKSQIKYAGQQISSNRTLWKIQQNTGRKRQLSQPDSPTRIASQSCIAIYKDNCKEYQARTEKENTQYWRKIKELHKKIKDQKIQYSENKFGPNFRSQLLYVSDQCQQCDASIKRHEIGPTHKCSSKNEKKIRRCDQKIDQLEQQPLNEVKYIIEFCKLNKEHFQKLINIEKVTQSIKSYQKVKQYEERKRAGSGRKVFKFNQWARSGNHP